MKAPGLLPLFAAMAMGLLIPSGNAQEGDLAWAYPMNPPDFQLASDDGSIRRVPDSAAGYTLTQTRDRFAATDWHPGNHPPMPEVVARGRKPDVFACGWGPWGGVRLGGAGPAGRGARRINKSTPVRSIGPSSSMSLSPRRSVRFTPLSRTSTAALTAVLPERSSRVPPRARAPSSPRPSAPTRSVRRFRRCLTAL